MPNRWGSGFSSHITVNSNPVQSRNSTDDNRFWQKGFRGPLSRCLVARAQVPAKLPKTYMKFSGVSYSSMETIRTEMPNPLCARPLTPSDLIG